MFSSDATSTSSPTTSSPFSPLSAHSDVTSDEAADLGAFTSVFQVLREQQPIRALYPMWQARAISSFTESSMTRSYSEATSSDNQVSDAPDQTTTVWTQRPIATYLNSTSSMAYSTEHYSEEFTAESTEDDDTHNDTYDDTEDQEGEGEREEEEEPIIDVGDDSSSSSSAFRKGDQPSLGYLDEVLNYLAAERERFAAEREREARTRALTGAWKHVVEPRRKRRKKKSGSNSSKGRSLSAIRILQRKQEQDSVADSDILEDAIPPRDNTSAEDDSYSSSIEVSSASNDAFRSVPATPPRNDVTARSLKLKLMHSRSNPDLRPTVPGEPFDPHVIGLRKLAHKLRMLFPADARRLAKIPNIRRVADEDWADPRGPAPQAHDTLTHIFIDHSNILIGFLTFLRRNRHLAKRYKHMSHDALALVLERGRPITRRVLVTSSPLYQPMESAERLEYEVRVYARVPDTGDGADRRHHQSSNDLHGVHHHYHQSHRHRRGKSGGDIGLDGTGVGAVSPSLKGRKGRRRASLSTTTATNTTTNTSSNNTSTESERSNAVSASSSSLARSSLLRPSLLQAAATTSMIGSAPAVTQLTTTTTSTTTITSTTTTRVRYREQGVDELLQLKLHQAIADVDPPPPGATIVLATGDGNVGQFNDDGFLGPVRTALKKGWRVELYAWEEGLSRAWKREFGDGPWKDRFVVIGMEQFGADLVQVPVVNA